MPKVADYRLIWTVEDQMYRLQDTRDHIQLQVVLESAKWFDWLDTVSSFAFQGKNGHYTAHKERRSRGDAYWYAYVGTGKKLIKKYLGKSIDVTAARLEQVAMALAHQEPVPEVLERDLPPETTTLLMTKLHVPQPRVQLVVRSRLLTQLEQSLKHGLTLVSAPTGFGKTTLLAQWLAESNTPVAWLSLEPEDNDPVRFLTYLIAALQTRHPSLGITILELLKTSQATPLERALTVLTNDIIGRRLADFVLVLDDYHAITNEAIHGAMTFLIEHLPSQMHLLLATRADPPLPLSRLRARGQLLELRAADLRMHANEVHTFLDTIMGLHLPSDAIAALESRTEGWAAGLQLAALSLQGRADVSTFLADFTGNHRFVLDYLSEEVLSRQPASVLLFLLQTSILERLSGSLCDAVTAQVGSQAMLEAFDQNNLFTSALDDQRHWYRYHHLFADVLRSHLRQTQPLLVPELHRRASLWYEQHEQSIEAVSHALAAEDVERAVQLIEHAATSLIVHGQTRTVLEWLNALPASVVRTHPFLAVSHAAALHLIDQVEQAEARLHDAERAITPETPSALARIVRGIAANVSANIARYSGDLPRYISLGQQASELLAESDVMLQAAPCMQSAHAYLLDGDVTPAMERKIRDIVMRASIADYPLVHFRSLTMLARFQTLQGRLNDAAHTYEEAGQAVPGTQVLQVLTASAAYCFGMADMLREWNRLEEAEHLLAQGMALIRGRQSVFADDIWLGFLTQARVQYARGAYTDALATLDAFIHLTDTRHIVPHFKSMAAMHVQITLMMDNLTEALRWVDESGLSRKDEELLYSYEREYLTLTRVLLAQGRETPAGYFFENALHLLNRLLQRAEAKGRVSSMLEILLLQALVLHTQGKRSHAFSVLERVLTLTMPERYVRLFVDEGMPMQALLRQYHPDKQRQLASYVALLLAAFDGQGITLSSSLSIPSSLNLLPEPLTEREREVLHLLMQGDSNRDIARRLVLSINTVKRHIYNICSKLGVQSRTQAILKARELGLY